MTNPETDLERELRRALHQADGDALAVPDMVERVGAGMARTRRRRRRGTTAAVLASAALVVGVSVVTANTGPTRSVDATETDRTDTQPFPAPPEGSKWVGMNRVVVAVPADWPVSESPCGAGAPNEVIDARNTTVDCSYDFSKVDTQVRFTTLDEALQRGDERVCTASPNPTCVGASTFEDQNFAVVVHARGADATDQIDGILSSAMVLPEGWVTVPFGEGATVEGRIGKLEAAGFEVNVTDAERIDRFAISVTPAVGAPVEEGSLIELAPLTTDPPTEGANVPGCRQVQVGTSTSATAEELTILLENGGETPCDLSGVRVAVTLGDLELGDRGQTDDFASQDTALPAGATAVLTIATNPGCQFSNQVFDINLDDGTSLTVIHPGEIGGECIEPLPAMELTAVEVLDAQGPATVAPDAQLVAQPTSVRPGEEFVVTSSETRGSAFTLVADDGTTYYLNVEDLDTTPSWDTDVIINGYDVAFRGPGRAIVPEVAAPGTYALCTTEAVAEACTELTVGLPSSAEVEVPDVLGLDVVEAERALQEVGFETVRNRQDCPVLGSCIAGVSRTSPGPGDRVNVGRVVVIDYYR